MIVQKENASLVNSGLRRSRAVQFARHLPEMSTSVTQVDNLRCVGEMLLSLIPDPFRSITHDDFLLGAAPTTLPSFQIEALAKLFGGFNRAHIGGRIRVADGVAFFIPGGL